MKVRDERAWKILAHVILIIFSALCVFPFVLMVIASFTDNAWATVNGFSLFPKEWSLEAYKYILQKWSTIGHAYLMTIVVTVVGTGVSLLISSMFAYTLSRRDLKGVKILNFLCIFTLLFNGGIVASYYMWVNVFHIKNTIFALLLPNLLMSGFNVILLKNYFANSVPESLLEAARIDGANEYRIYAQIVLPLSLPIMATVGMMTALTYWNDWTNGLYYLSNRGGSQFYTIQLVLNNISENLQLLISATSSISVSVNDLPSTTVRLAMAAVAALPIIIVFPFFERFFVEGITLGGVKE